MVVCVSLSVERGASVRGAVCTVCCAELSETAQYRPNQTRKTPRSRQRRSVWCLFVVFAMWCRWMLPRCLGSCVVCVCMLRCGGSMAPGQRRNGAGERERRCVCSRRLFENGRTAMRDAGGRVVLVLQGPVEPRGGKPAGSGTVEGNPHVDVPVYRWCPVSIMDLNLGRSDGEPSTVPCSVLQCLQLQQLPDRVRSRSRSWPMSTPGLQASLEMQAQSKNGCAEKPMRFAGTASAAVWMCSEVGSYCGCGEGKYTGIFYAFFTSSNVEPGRCRADRADRVLFKKRGILPEGPSDATRSLSPSVDSRATRS